MIRTDDDFELGTIGVSGTSGNLIGDPVEFLVFRHFPELAALANRDLCPSLRNAREKKEASFRGQLNGMPAKEFEALFKEEKEKWFYEMRSKSGIIEESVDFMHHMYNADLAKWGAQVLFGFQFNGMFQEAFADLHLPLRLIACAGLVLIMIATGLLIAPSMQHRSFRAHSHGG